MASINISSFAGAGAQFFDANGTPLAGGLLYVYTAGTTTPATTYTSPSGTVNNTNPIVLDAGGRTPYEIWVNGGVLYKFVLKTSTGVTIGTYDSIPAVDDPTAFNNIITVTGTNTLVGTSTPPNTAYTTGMTLSFVAVNTNTTAVTIDVDGLGAKEITIGSSALSGGELVAGRIVQLEYDGTRFQLSVAYIPDSAVTTAKLADSTVTTAKLADGSVTTAKFASGAVNAAVAASSAGAVGTYMMANLNNGAAWPYTVTTGSTLAGSSLFPASIKNSGGTFSISISGTALSGTWRFMSYTSYTSGLNDAVGLWLRIS